MRYHGYHSSRKQHQAAQKAPTYLASSEQLDQWKRPHGKHHQQNVSLYLSRFFVNSPVTLSLLLSLFWIGFTSLALDPTGGNIFVTCTDNSIYQFNTTNISYPIARYTARTLHISSFYIRCSVSPDGRYVASGSGDSNVHVWQVGATTLTKSDYDSNRRRYGQHEYLRHKSSTMRDSGSSSGGISRQMKPSIMLKVHTQEVTGIDWNKSFPDQVRLEEGITRGGEVGLLGEP